MLPQSLTEEKIACVENVTLNMKVSTHCVFSLYIYITTTFYSLETFHIHSYVCAYVHKSMYVYMDVWVRRLGYEGLKGRQLKASKGTDSDCPIDLFLGPCSCGTLRVNPCNFPVTSRLRIFSFSSNFDIFIKSFSQVLHNTAFGWLVSTKKSSGVLEIFSNIALDFIQPVPLNFFVGSRLNPLLLAIELCSVSRHMVSIVLYLS